MTQQFKPSIDPDPINPLIRFRGTLTSYTAEARKPRNNPDGREYQVVVFNLADLEVLESTEVFPFKETNITLFYNNRGKTEWTAWAASLKAASGITDIDDLVGKRSEWVQQDVIVNQKNRESGQYEDMARKGWTVAAVEGVSGGNGTSAAIWEALPAAFDGKTEKECKQLLFSDDALKEVYGYQAAVDMALEDKLFVKLTGEQRMIKMGTGAAATYSKV